MLRSLRNSRLRLLAVSLLSAAAFGQTDYRFSSGGQSHLYSLSANEVQTTKGIATVPAGVSLRQYGRQLRSGSGGAPVFYDKQDLPSPDKLASMRAPARENRIAAARRVMTASLLVKMDAGRVAELEPTAPLAHETSLLDGWRLVRYRTPFEALDAADWMLKAGGWEFTPVFARKMEKRQLMQRPVNDPLYPMQWHLMARGFNLSMRNVWDSVTGKGINIAVVDDGLDIGHEDLRDNAYPIESGYHFNFNDGPDADPSPLTAEQSHGTSCAGLAAASGFNNRGLAGVAPEARLMGLRLIAGNAAEDATGAALAWQPRGVVTHVSSNSWGPADDGADSGRMAPLAEAGMRKATAEYRNGLGTVFVISCGNGRGNGDDSSYDGFSSSRLAIAVAAVNRNGEQSSYSESGMNVAISALGGEFDPPGVMWTTNVSGEEAFLIKETNHPTSEAPMHYTDAFNGTSSAAPQISGAVALMLEKNPRLGYRDVKEILIRTANREGLRGADSFRANGAGIPFSHSFGAGLVDVSAAVERAAGWRNLGPLVSAEITDRATEEIPDGESGVVRSFDFSALPRIRVEHVELIVNAAHENRGDLGFVIAAPSGMRSIAEPRAPDKNSDFVGYKFTSVRHWGEESAGVWRVLVADTAANGVSGEIGSVTLRIFGTTLN